MRPVALEGLSWGTRAITDKHKFHRPLYFYGQCEFNGQWFMALVAAVSFRPFCAKNISRGSSDSFEPKPDGPETLPSNPSASILLFVGSFRLPCGAANIQVNSVSIVKIKEIKRPLVHDSIRVND